MSIEASSPTSTTTNIIIKRSPSLNSTNMSNHNSTSEAKDIAPLEHDWQRWAPLMLAHFMEWDLDSIVDGTETAPDDDASEEVKLAFIKRQKKAAGFIS